MVPPEHRELQAQLSQLADGLQGALAELQEISAVYPGYPGPWRPRARPEGLGPAVCHPRETPGARRYAAA